MSWGTELWDQFEGVSYHTNKGIDFLDKYGSFVKERCAIEIEYANKLKRLVKNHQYKKKDESDTQFTYVQAFVQMLKEISDLAGQHEMINENLTNEVTGKINNLVKEFKEERKKYLTEGQKLHNTLTTSYLQLDKSKKHYERAFREAEKAHEHFEKVDADFNLSRAEVEKARQVSQAKTQLADNLKSEYATNLQKTNELQRIHYQDQLPQVFNQLQELEKRRIQSTQNFIYQGAKAHLDVFPIIEKCLQGIVSASELVDANKDCDYVIERYKSGMEPPEDLPFEDLSNPSTDQNNGKDTMKGTMVYAKLKKRAGFFNIFGSNKTNFDEFKEEIYADLPPVQRRKRLQEKLNGIQEQLNKENNAREGLMKMKQAFLDNGALGDPASLEPEFNENANKLKKLQLEAEKYEKYLSELNNAKPASKLNGSQQSGQNRSSISEESLSRSASDSSVSHPQQAAAAAAAATTKNGGAPNGLNNKPVFKTINSSNLNTFKATLNGQLNGNSATSSGVSSNAGSSNYEQDHSPDMGGHNSKINLSNVDFIDGEENEEEFEIDLISYGKAKALYAFEPESEGAIKMVDNEMFDVVELDQGDGWTRVRRANLEEGFVPTSYLEIRLND